MVDRLKLCTHRCQYTPQQPIIEMRRILSLLDKAFKKLVNQMLTKEIKVTWWNNWNFIWVMLLLVFIEKHVEVVFATCPLYVYFVEFAAPREEYWSPSNELSWVKKCFQYGYTTWEWNNIQLRGNYKCLFAVFKVFLFNRNTPEIYEFWSNNLLD